MSAFQRFSAALVLAMASVAPALAEVTDLTLVVPNPSAINNYPLHVAVGEGYFADEGLNVRVEAVNGSASVLQLLASGQGHIGQPGPGPLMAARARGEDMVMIYNHFARSVFGLVVPEDSPAQTSADLKGVVIGVGTADGAEVAFTRGIMTDLGLVEGQDYEFLAIGDGGTAVAAFLNNEVGAYAAAVADAAIISARGIPLREITPEPYLEYFGNGWAVSRAFLTANPTTLEGFGRALVRGTQFGLDPANRAAVLRHVATGNPQESEDQVFAGALLDAIQSRTIPVSADSPHGYFPPAAWQLWHDSLVGSGDLAEPVADLTAAYTNQFVEQWNAGQ
ncbi:ABC transporter substrate-binding protein [Ketogulonicigenium vulgare]|uniref:ABC transporter substrate-binding protein n=1 Tax=Ketogulonicigenium vulgare TaxID=92945 RepID=UPI0023588923|nr:ABC transporter substrate-binding protein [Ketogulonicigenium vulgare]